MSNTNAPESQTNSMMAILVVIAIAVVLFLVGTANPADSLPPQTAESVAQASESLAGSQADDEDVAAEDTTDETADADTAETTDETGDEATTDDATAEEETTGEQSATGEEEATTEETTESTEEAVVVAFSAEKAYNISCSACHGLDGLGVDGAGSLAGSTLVSDTEALTNFIIAGSGEMVDPATGMPHPILGTDFYSAEEVAELAGYTASLVGDAPAESDESSEESSEESSTEAEDAATEVATGEEPATTEETAFDATAAYNLSCAGCHATDGSGVEGLAQPLSPDSELIADSEAYLDFLVTGTAESVDMGMVHPPRGGAADYSDEELNAIIDYTLTLFE